MIFAEFARERLFSNFKSGLLCAVILMPATTLADPPQISSEVAPQAATAPAAASATAPTTTPPEITSAAAPTTIALATTAQVTTTAPDTGPKTASTGETKAASGGKAISLSRHIQDKYKISESKAAQIVRAAMVNGDRHQLEPELILAIIAVESTFKERAVSRVGARGLMQVTPGIHRKKVQAIGGSRALFDPAKNIHTGSQILVTYLNDHSGDLRRALLNYNGSLGMRSSYADRVMRIYRDFQRVTTES